MHQSRPRWHDTIGRRTVGTVLFAAARGVGSHPAVLLESRDGAASGPQVYLNAPCDEATPLVIAPPSAAVTARMLHSVGPRFPVRASAVSARARPALLSSMFGDQCDWLELAWRLAIERCARVSRYWGWLALLPDLAAQRDEAERVERLVRIAKPRCGPSHSAASRTLEAEVAACHHSMAALAVPAVDAATPGLVPPLPALRWAVGIVLRRATRLPRSIEVRDCGSDSITTELGILPLLDLAPWASAGDVPKAGVEILLAPELPPWYTDAHHRGSPFSPDAEQLAGRDSPAPQRRSRRQLRRCTAPGEGADADAARLLCRNTSAVASAPFFFALTLREAMGGLYDCRSVTRDPSEMLLTGNGGTVELSDVIRWFRLAEP